MKEEVKELLENAESNGYPVWSNPPEDIADEIIEQTGFFEDRREELINTIIDVVADYVAQNREGR